MATIIKEKRKYAFDIDYSRVLPFAFFDSFKQLNPLIMIRNPIIFLVEICFLLMLALTINPNLLGESFLNSRINLLISILLLLTILFGNFAENIAKHIARAQSDSSRIIHGDIEVKRLKPDGMIEYVFASLLTKGNIVKVQEGDLIPLDGEVIEGVASVDESAITGESSPVLKEPGTDTSSSVTGGTRILTDWLLIKITSEHGQTYLDQMVSIAESAERHKTPNEMSLNSLLIASTISFLLVVITLPAIMHFIGIKIEPAFMIALLVCLVPTTISSLVAPIRISGFDRMNQLNVLSMSEKSLETAGDINVLLLDKTGTITFGNRMAIEFIPLGTYSISDVTRVAYLTSYFDQTPEGKSILSLAQRLGIEIDIKEIKGIPHEFTAHTRMSGIDLEGGDILRKGASDSIKKLISTKNGKTSPSVDQLVETIAIQGGTPLLISKNAEIIGLIHLKDIVKPNMKYKFKEMNSLV